MQQALRYDPGLEVGAPAAQEAFVFKAARRATKPKIRRRCMLIPPSGTAGPASGSRTSGGSRWSRRSSSRNASGSDCPRPPVPLLPGVPVDETRVLDMGEQEGEQFGAPSSLTRECGSRSPDRDEQRLATGFRMGPDHRMSDVRIVGLLLSTQFPCTYVIALVAGDKAVNRLQGSSRACISSDSASKAAYMSEKSVSPPVLAGVSTP